MSVPERPAKILVVDDEEQIRRALKAVLSARKFKVIFAANGSEAIDLAIDNSPDLIILDLVMPILNGAEVCKALREWYAGPILMLSVKNTEEEKIKCLDMGADDYLTKPFSAGELLARVRALLRRSNQLINPPRNIIAGELEIDFALRKVKLQGKEVVLTPTEFDILAYLAQNPDRILTSKMIMEKIWGPGYGEDNATLRVHISNLRKKIEPHASIPCHILTEPGIGFRFVLT